MAKVSKASANYSKGMPSAHCGICRHFREPHSCEIVEGQINPSMWCRFFKKRSALADALRKGRGNGY